MYPFFVLWPDVISWWQKMWRKNIIPLLLHITTTRWIQNHDNTLNIHPKQHFLMTLRQLFIEYYTPQIKYWMHTQVTVHTVHDAHLIGIQDNNDRHTTYKTTKLYFIPIKLPWVFLFRWVIYSDLHILKNICSDLQIFSRKSMKYRSCLSSVIL